MADADAVVIGAGSNGLVAANHLADRGWNVIVLEATSWPGGAVRSSELVEPGFVADHCSAFYPLAAGSRALLDLRLEDHGLRWVHSPQVLAHPHADGTCPVLSRDLDTTATSLDMLGPGDGDAWRALYQRWVDLEPHLLDTFLAPMPPVRGASQLVRRIGPKELARFARFCLLPVRRMGEEEFVGDGAKRLLAGAALHADMSPEAALSGFLGWLLCSLGQGVGFPVPEGGAQSVTSALVRRLDAIGGRVLCDSAVGRVVVERGRAVGVELADGSPVRARRAVVADVNAPMLYLELVGADLLPPKVVADIRRFHWDDATFKVDWTLDGPIPWSASEARMAGTVHVTEGVDALTVTASELARGLVPRDPFLLVGQQSMTDPTRQPAGKETAWAYTHVPRRIRGDAGCELTGDWGKDDVARFASRMETKIEALAPGFRSLVRGRYVQSPLGFQAENPNSDLGAISGGTSQLHQQLVFRPIPGLGRADTPIKGLFLGSSSAHPGGGLHGAAGRNAAQAAVAADRRATVISRVRRRT